MHNPAQGNDGKTKYAKDHELNNIGKANRKGLAFGRYAFGDGRDFRPNAKPLQNYRLYLILIPKNTRIKSWLTSNWKFEKRFSTAGFTLLELSVIVVIISILFAIMVPGWAGFMNTQRLNSAQNTVLQAMREAQSRANQSHIVWQVSFQTSNDTVQWAVHPIGVTPAPSVWSSLDSTIQIDAETTLQQSGSIRRVQFDHEGHVNGQLGRLTLSGKSGGKVKRCVVVSTLLGAIRTGSNHPTMQDGKYCY